MSVTSFDMKENKSRASLWLLSAFGGEPRRLTSAGEKDGEPRWSPDGKWIAFVAKRQGSDGRKDDEEAHPDLQRTAVIGHLAGAAIALNLAIDAAEDKLPTPKLVFALMPGGIASDPKSRGISLEDLGKLDSRTLLIAMSGDRDHLPTDRASRRILRETTAVPANQKLFMRAPSDSHGYPVTSATLASPGSPLQAYDAEGIKLPPDPPRDPKEKAPCTFIDRDSTALPFGSIADSMVLPNAQWMRFLSLIPSITLRHTSPYLT